MRIFAEIEASRAFAEQLQQAKDIVDSLNGESLNQLDDESHVLRILSSVRINPLYIKFDEAYVTTHDQMIPAQNFPHGFDVEHGRSYSRQTIKYHIPFDGDRNLLRWSPRLFATWTMDVEVRDGEITFDIINFSNDSNKVNTEANQLLARLRQEYDLLEQKVEAFNTSSQAQIVQMLSNRRAKIKKDNDFLSGLDLPVKRSETSKSISSNSPVSTPPLSSSSLPDPEATVSWDVFISHASEDKETFVRGLAQELVRCELKVWYDEFTLKLGDSLRRSIDRGLANSRFGIVVLSPNFFSKEWPQRELDGLVAKEVSSGKVILPIWHNISREEVTTYSPTLADRLAVRSNEGIERVIEDILSVIKGGAK
ncbi:MAG: toll/interleukin-1 receptor domain-containing protein [Thermoleophilia bacterium]